MIKYYKNVCETTLNLNLYGIGKVHIPADAKCIPLEAHVAEAVMGMTPLKILEEVTPDIEEASEVLVTKGAEIVEPVTPTEEIQEAPSLEAPSPFQLMTLEEMREYCTANNIEFSKSAGREVMLKKLINL